MRHWSSFSIGSFRRLSKVTLDDLGAVNLLVGENNCGKTTLLEALAIATDPLDLFTWWDVARERELKSSRTPPLDVIRWMFPQRELDPVLKDFPVADELTFQTTKETTHEIIAWFREFRSLSLEQEGEDSGMTASLDVTEEVSRGSSVIRKHSSEFEIDEKVATSGLPDRTLPCQLVTTVSHRTSRQLLEAVDQVIAQRKKDDVVQLMQKFSPDIEDIEIRSPKGQGAVIHLYHKGIGHVPLAMEGDGIRRALSFAAAATMARGGLLLIDEIEAALHPSALQKVFHFLVQSCEEMDVQLFVSTHSLEAVDAMLSSVGDDVEKLTAYHLPDRNSDQDIYRLSGKSVHSMRTQSGLDLR